MTKTSEDLKIVVDILSGYLDKIESIENRINLLEMNSGVGVSNVSEGTSDTDMIVRSKIEMQIKTADMQTLNIDKFGPIKSGGFDTFWKLTPKRKVKVAIVDTGIDIHDYLRPNIRGGVNYASGSKTDWIDRNGHGTNVASIVKMVYPEVELYAVKVIGDDGRGSNDSLVRGLDWCLYNKMDVVNMSLGSQRPYAPLEMKVRELYEAGIYICCAAGNDYMGSRNTVDYPGRYDEHVITVAAVNNSNDHAYFSSAGKEVDFAVRGVQVYGAIKAPDVWGYMSGTSQATPHVSGLIASALAHFPGVERSTLLSIMSKTATDRGAPGEDNEFGAGVLNPNAIKEELMKNV